MLKVSFNPLKHLNQTNVILTQSNCISHFTEWYNYYLIWKHDIISQLKKLLKNFKFFAHFRPCFHNLKNLQWHRKLLVHWTLSNHRFLGLRPSATIKVTKIFRVPWQDPLDVQGPRVWCLPAFKSSTWNLVDPLLNIHLCSHM